MSKLTKIVLQQEVLDLDIPDITTAFESNLNGLQECMAKIEEELERIRLFPDRQGKECEYEPLKSAGCRKDKVFSSKSLQTTKGEAPDLRIIYRYDDTTDTVRVESIGFRVKEKPRPDHDPYSKAGQRIIQREQERNKRKKGKAQEVIMLCLSC
ncbi:hypothetical protein [Paenibacillus sp. 32O-W]|uniref:hypothetical protein n=1 Tax=Paenibacillus sp. 32O-W TaxID=1695218 RepID=UPI0011A69322|nr:hypothetical protein [Paenibacillus sp. 32O-W]